MGKIPQTFRRTSVYGNQEIRTRQSKYAGGDGRAKAIQIPDNFHRLVGKLSKLVQVLLWMVNHGLHLLKNPVRSFIERLSECVYCFEGAAHIP